LWGVFTHFSSGRKKLSAEATWAILNFLFVAVVLLYLVNNSIYIGGMPEQERLPRLLVIACVARSVLDYFFCREFYFPKAS
jgi:hypothetical protein